MTDIAGTVANPGTSMTCEIRSTITATARVDLSGWDITYNLRLIATNSSGYPYNNGVNSTGSVSVEGTTRGSWAGTYNFPSGHGTGYSITLVSTGSYFKPVTADGTGSVALANAFSGYGGTPLGSGSSSGSLTLPTILLGPSMRVSSTWKHGPWKTFKTAVAKTLTLKFRSGGAWKTLK